MYDRGEERTKKYPDTSGRHQMAKTIIIRSIMKPLDPILKDQYRMLRCIGTQTV